MGALSALPDSNFHPIIGDLLVEVPKADSREAKCVEGVRIKEGVSPPQQDECMV